MTSSAIRASADALERALDLAEPDALVIAFLTFPRCDELLARHPRHRNAHGSFLKDIVDFLAGASPESARPHAPSSQEDLSPAELRVLRLLPTNLHVSDMAAELYVSANTIKTHMRHIYAKLDAHSRTGAVERARELGLLSPSGRS